MDLPVNTLHLPENNVPTIFECIVSISYRYCEYVLGTKAIRRHSPSVTAKFYFEMQEKPKKKKAAPKPKAEKPAKKVCPFKACVQSTFQ